MAQELKLTLLGGFQLTLNEQDISRNLSNKAQGLICYLAVQSKPQTRQHLASLFWPEVSDENALRSLRVELAKIRPFLESHLDISRLTIGWNNHAPYWLDVEAFEHLLKQSKLAQGAMERSWLQEAIDLYSGEFLAGYLFDDAHEFQLWMLRQRENLELSAIDALISLVNICIEQADYVAGIEYARRLLALEPWREDAHRQLMWLYAQNGQRLDALMQYETCRTILRNELGIIPAEETRRLHERILTMEESPERAKRPLPAISQPPITNDTPFLAPPLLPYFTGRDKEVAILRDYLCQPPDGVPRRYCLTGFGGIGKTTLTIQIAHVMRDHFPDGVLWANVATGDLTVLAENWAAAYGYNFSSLPDFDNQALALRHLLEEKQALLIFDDVATAASIRPFLPQNDRAVVLFTTRQADQAQLLQAQVIHIDELDPKDGRLLLEKILGTARVGLESEATDEICRLLHNHPLALSIAAHRMAFRPRRKLADLVSQLHDESERLDLSLRDREVRASFAISWRGLDSLHQHVFSTLAIFEGRPFTAEALAAILQTNRFQSQDYLDNLAALSLLNQEGDHHYRQHPLLADFSSEHLDQEQAIPLYHHLVTYYLSYATIHRSNYPMLQLEWDNFTAAIQHAHQLRLWQTILDYIQTLQEAWFSRGRYSQARQVYKLAHEAAMALEDETHLAQTLLYWGQACVEQNSYDEATLLLSQSLQLYQELNNPNGQGDAYYQLARIAKIRGQNDTAVERLNQALGLREASGDMAGISDIFFQQADIFFGTGLYPEAESLARRSLDIQLSIDHKIGAIRSLRALTRILFGLNNQATDLGEQYLQQALALCEELDDIVELAMTLLILCGVHIDRANLALAQEYGEKSLDLLKKIGDRRAQSQAYYNLSRTSRAKKEYAQAFEWAQQGLKICQELNDRHGLAFTLKVMGELKQECNEPEQAAQIWQQALQLAQEINHQELARTIQKNLETIRSITISP